MKRTLMFLATIAAAGVSMADAAAGEGLVEEKGCRPWRLTIGPVVAPRVRVKVHGPSQAAVPRQAAGSSGFGADVPADPSAGYAAREYADGYVRPDEGTDDPDTMVSGLTWNWGAKNVPSQYSEGKMEFRTGMARWTEDVHSPSYSGGTFSDSDRDVLVGIQAMGGWTFLDEERFDAAVDFGFRFYGNDDQKISSQYGTTVTTVRNEYRYVDRYDASGWTEMPVGAYEGTAGGPGRLLGAAPEREEELMRRSSSREECRYYSDTKLEYRIWDLRIGPTLGWKAADWLTVRGGVYGLLGLVDAKLKTAGGETGGADRAKKSKCDAVFGVAAGLSAEVRLSESLFLAGGVEYDWWSDKTTLRAGGADAEIKLSDFTFSLALGYEF